MNNHVNTQGISFVILCYKSEFHLSSLVSSILQQSNIPHENLEIIVVDNWGAGEEEKITFKLAEKYDAEFIYKRAEKNLGYGAGNNIGIKLSKYEIICIVNPDVRFISPIFKNALAEFVHKPNLMALSGEQISKSRNSFFLRPEFQFPIVKEIISRLLKHVGIFSHRFMAISGAMTFYRKSLFLDIGLFDEKIFLYGEESDVSIRALRSGYELSFVPELKYIHLDWDLVGPSVSNIGYLISSVSYYQKKHNVSCRGYFLAGRIHFFVKSILFLFLGRSSDASEAKSLIGLYRSKNI